MSIIRQILEEALHDFELHDLSRDSSLPLDSLTLAQILIIADKQFNIQIPLKDALRMSLVKDVFAVIEPPPIAIIIRSLV